MGITGEQVYMGLGGLFIIEDEVSAVVRIRLEADELMGIDHSD